ncbi:hypothetical protein TD95_001180 [Thielaviopsis punctulata]|uniref:Uncharacterized protein n=1 Tax=Thielaviopsis punctulata TaxID=72032 RepID=A0A0F4ZHU8_9PEZI|nr:hypothetical protein TD95_001180 [Thielaviopsis punctulata]
MLRWYQARLAARPILTQAVTTSILFATGDVTAQLFIEPKKEGEKTGYDFARTGRMALYGGGEFIIAIGLIFVFFLSNPPPPPKTVVFGPCAATWYKFLSKNVVLPNSNAQMAARVLCDQGIFAPVFIGVFLSSMAVLEGNDPKEKLANGYRGALTSNYYLWPAVQVVNFKFVPLQHRLLFTNVISIGWNGYLSFLNSQA